MVPGFPLWEVKNGQTGWMPRLIRVLAETPGLLVLSFSGSVKLGAKIREIQLKVGRNDITGKGEVVVLDL